MEEQVLWVVREHPEGKRVTVHDGDSQAARVIVTEVMSPAEYQARRAATRKNKHVAVVLQEAG